jgi:hypothetical protein
MPSKSRSGPVRVVGDRGHRTGAWLLVAALAAPCVVRAQAGPPFLSNDPGTPGNGHWEINLASTQVISRGAGSYETPQIDLNYGIGERIQLTFEVPYVLQSDTGQPTRSGWGNAYPGIKWRFLDQGEDGWQASIFPQVETGVSMASQREGIGSSGPRVLLPLEAARKVGIIDLDFEAGYYFPVHGAHELILGVVAGRQVTQRLELDVELYEDHARGTQPHNTTLDLGGRFKLHPGVIALFMAGRNLGAGYADGEPEFVGYFGVQLLLKNYGLALADD